MRLKDYLNEGFMKLEQALEYIDDNCQPYISELQRAKRVGGLLLSGRREANPFFTDSIRKDRRPKDTPRELHDLLDELFEQEYGLKPRSQSLFCNPKMSEIRTYGSPYFIFPIGRFKIVWSETVDDLWGVLEDSEYILAIDEEGARDKAQDEWEGTYSEGKQGYWSYGEETFEGTEQEAIEHFTDKEMEFVGEIEDEEAERERNRDMIEGRMEWNPDISEEQYVEERTEELLKEAENEIRRDIIENYTVGNLDKALMYDHEIMVMGSAYVAISATYINEIIDFLKERGIIVNRNRLREYDI